MKAKGGLEAPGQALPEQGTARGIFESRQTDSVYKGIGQPGHGAYAFLPCTLEEAMHKYP